MKIVYTKSWKIEPFHHARPFVPLEEHERIVARLEKHIKILSGTK